jgi:hypothetical protein
MWACPHITETLQLLAHVEDDTVTILEDNAASALDFIDGNTKAATSPKTLVTVHTNQHSLYPKSFAMFVSNAVRPSGFQFHPIHLLQCTAKSAIVSFFAISVVKERLPIHQQQVN